MKNRKRNRMQGFDYSSNNLYFVTICVQDRKCCFGSVIPVGTGRDLSVHNPNKNHPNKNHSDINHSDINHSNKNNPNKNHSNKNHFDENHSNKNHSDENIIMQLNQFGVIVHEKINWLQEQYKYVDIHNFVVMPNHIHIILEIDSLKVNKERIKIKSLSSLIGALKTTSSKEIHLLGFLDFAWQRSFHDHIIRNEKSYTTIFNYVDRNPQKWHQDTFFENIKIIPIG